ncbi:hypothetical protein GQ55_9G513300 [Panicum hallii var. hallii]|uniref:Uncharacterized protein n=1 Tax=Panicum hallii var. hallii TaxID=1504633 RepID=A0A2T7CDW3_9POAL|nr:hypothetical protein GQ55_9G513300 [Panicum hallii var. hallii]
MVGNSRPVGGVDETMGAASGWRTTKNHLRRAPVQKDVGSGIPNHHPRRAPLQIETRSCRLQIDGKAEDKVDGNGWRTPGSRARGSTGGNVAKEKDKQVPLSLDYLCTITPHESRRCHLPMPKLRMRVRWTCCRS